MSTSSAAAPPVFTRKRILVILTGLMLAQMIAAIEGTVLATAAPTVAADLQGFKLFSWVFNSFLITSTVTTPLWGKLSDLLGRRRLYELAIVVFMVGSVLCGASTSMEMLIGARAFQGVGAGGIFTLTMTIMGDIISPKERGKYQAYMVGIFSIATVIGPFVGGLFIDYASWRWIFYMNLPLGFGALVMSWFTLKLPFSRRPHTIDYGGAVLLTVWVVAALVVMHEGHVWGWGSGRSLATIAIALVALALFIAQERRAAEPILPPRLFRERIVTVTSAAQIFVGAAMFGIALYVPLFLQVVAGQKATRAGLLVMPMTLGMMAGSTLSGRRISRQGSYRIYPIVGGVIMAVAMALLAAMDRDSSRFAASAYMTLFGIGAGMTFIVTLLGVQNKVDHQDLGIATSASNFFRSLGNSFGTAVFGAVFITQLDSQLARLAPSSGYSAATLSESPAQINAIAELAVREGVIQSFTNALHWVFLVSVPFCIVAFAFAWLIPEYPLRHDTAVGVTEDSLKAQRDALVPAAERQ